jgi:hypothetical protein
VIGSGSPRALQFLESRKEGRKQALEVGGKFLCGQYDSSRRANNGRVRREHSPSLCRYCRARIIGKCELEEAAEWNKFGAANSRKHNTKINKSGP